MKYHIVAVASLFTFTLVHCQFFDPILDDKTYLDNIQKDVVTELEEAKNELMTQAKVVENVTRAYIAAKLKENVFKALRMIAENELRKAAHNAALRPKVPKQDSEDEDDDDTTPRTTTPLTGLGTAVKVNQQVFDSIGGVLRINHQVFGFLGEAFKIIFGGGGGGAAAQGGKPKTKRTAVEPAGTLMSKPQDVQLLGVISLLARDAENLPSVDAAPVIVPTVTKYPGYANFVKTKGASAKKGAANDDTETSDEDDVVKDVSQDARIFNLFALLGLGGRQQAGATKVVVASKNETLSGFDEEEKKTGVAANRRPQLNIEQFVKNFRQSMTELQASVPDIYRGVREAYKLLETVRGVAERVEEYFSEIFD